MWNTAVDVKHSLLPFCFVREALARHCINAKHLTDVLCDFVCMSKQFACQRQGTQLDNRTEFCFCVAMFSDEAPSEHASLRTEDVRFQNSLKTHTLKFQRNLRETPRLNCCT